MTEEEARENFRNCGYCHPDDAEMAEKALVLEAAAMGLPRFITYMRRSVSLSRLTIRQCEFIIDLVRIRLK